MAGDLTNNGESKALGALTAEPYLKLHTGDPGEEGTANAGAETTRKKITLAAASEGKRASSTEAKWEEYGAEETVKWVSAWSAATEGTNEWKAEIGEHAIEEGDTLIIKSGKVSISIN